MSIWMLLLFALAMAGFLLGQAVDSGHVWVAWLASLVSSAMFISGVLRRGVRKPVV